MHEIFCTLVLLFCFFLWAEPVTWAKMKIKIKIEVSYWRWQTRMHQRQTRSSSVTVSACTVPDCQTWSVYRRTARVPTNHVRDFNHSLCCHGRMGSPSICKQPEAYSCGIQKGNMAEVEKVAALFTLLFSLWYKIFVVYYPMTWLPNIYT